MQQDNKSSQGESRNIGENKLETHNDDDDDQWHYSPDRALASLTGFMIVL
jgi:hypothetical protein